MKRIIILLSIGILSVVACVVLFMRSIFQTRAGTPVSISYIQNQLTARIDNTVRLVIAVNPTQNNPITSLQFQLTEQRGSTPIEFVGAHIVGNDGLELIQAERTGGMKNGSIQIVATQFACVVRTVPFQIHVDFHTTDVGVAKFAFDSGMVAGDPITGAAYDIALPTDVINITTTFTDSGIPITLPPVPQDRISVYVSMRLQGITSGRTTLQAPVRMGVAFAGGSLREKTEFQYMTMQSDAQGIWSGFVTFPTTVLKPGDKYRLILKGPKHIARRYCVANPIDLQGDGTYICNPQESNITLKNGFNVFDLTHTYLMVGDLGIEPSGQDGLLDSRDIAFVISRLSDKEQDSLVIADMNYDTIVDTQDLALMIINLQRNEDEQ